MPDNILTVVQVAEYLKVCEKTVRRLIARQELRLQKLANHGEYKE